MKWIDKLETAEKVVIHDYLPGDSENVSSSGEVALQRVSITIIPAMLVSLSGEQDRPFYISGNQIFSNYPRNNLNIINVVLVGLALLSLLILLGFLVYMHID